MGRRLQIEWAESAEELKSRYRQEKEASGAPDESCLRLIADGAPREEFPAVSAGEQTWQVPPDGAPWYIAELRDKDGAMLAVTNPIFLQEK